MKKQTAYIKCFSIAAICIIASISMSITAPPVVFAASNKICALSLELQDQQARMQYASRLATVISNQPTSVEAMYQNTEPASYSNDSGFTLFGFGDSDHQATSSSSSVSGIDQFSAECLTCHDGVTATQVQPKIKEFPNNLKTYDGRSAKDHSIGMRYGLYVGNGSYKPVTDVSSQMLFIDGKVGCLTCHNPINPEKKHLVMSDAKSALCLTCHIR